MFAQCETPKNITPRSLQNSSSIIIMASCKWTREQIEHLIITVSKFPALYNTKCPDYSNRKKRDTTWQTVSNLISKHQGITSVEECKRKFKVLRDQFVKENRKCCSTTDKIISPRLWCYDLMTFLDDNKFYSASPSKINRNMVESSIPMKMGHVICTPDISLPMNNVPNKNFDSDTEDISHLKDSDDLITIKEEITIEEEIDNFECAVVQPFSNQDSPEIFFTVGLQDNNSQQSDNANISRNSPNNEENSSVSLPYECPLCKERFTSDLSRIEHVNRIHQRYVPIKPKEQKVISKELYTSNFVPQKQKIRSIQCKKCKKMFSSGLDLIQHRKFHCGQKAKSQNECPLCQKTFATEKLKIEHAFKVHEQHISIKPKEQTFSSSEQNEASEECPSQDSSFQKNRMKYYCKKCKVSCSNLSQWIKHQKSKHDPKRNYACQLCSSQFHSQKALDDHFIAEHPGKLFSCEQCERKFSRINYLVKHSKVHSLNRERKYGCEICEKRFYRHDELITHTYIHTGERPFVCTYCDKGCTTLTNLKVHLHTHTGYPFPCDKCGRAFSTQKLLSVHNLSHTGGYRFKCEFCEKTFLHTTPFKRHLWAHTGEKPYACSLCDKKYRYQKSLKIHTYTHTGEKPFMCETCGRCFTSETNVKTHQKTHLKTD